MNLNILWKENQFEEVRLRDLTLHPILLLESPFSSVRPLVTKFQPHCSCNSLSARRAQRRKSRGPKGLQLEVGARRAPWLLVIYIIGKLWISAFSWYSKTYFFILLAVRISVTHPDRLRNSFCVLAHSDTILIKDYNKSWVAFLQGFLLINPSGRVIRGNFSFYNQRVQNVQ